MISLFDNINSRAHLLNLSEIPGIEIPEYVANYSPLTKEAASKLDENFFGDPDCREYPIDSKAATWLSAGLFSMQKHAGDLPYAETISEWVWSNISKAASIFDIADEVRELRTVVGTVEKQAVDPDSHYGWIAKDAAGNTVERRYPMFDALGVHKAAVYFDANRGGYAQTMRRRVSNRILEKAATFGIDSAELPVSVLKEAGHGIPSRTVIMREIIERAQLAKDAEAAALLANVGAVVGASDESELWENLDKIAGIVEEFDTINGLANRCGVENTFPSDFLYSVDEKTARETLDNTLILGNIAFDKQALFALDPSEAFEPVLGPNFTEREESAEKLANKLASLSKSSTLALIDHLRLL